MIAQGGEGLSGPTTAEAGGTIEVSVGPYHRSLELELPGGSPTKLPVPPNKTVTIPVPSLPGEVIRVTIGKGLTKRQIFITIVAPAP